MYVANNKLSDYITKNYPETDEFGYINFSESQIGDVKYDEYRFGTLVNGLKYVKHKSEVRAFLLGEFLLPKNENPEDFFFQEQIYVSGDVESGRNQGESVFLSIHKKIENTEKSNILNSIGYDTVKGRVGGKKL